MSNIIADRLFDLIKGSVLELGPHSGEWFTEDILKHTDSVTAIELDSIAVDTLKRRYPTVDVKLADYHSAVKGVGLYDNVVLFGVLTHTHSPLGLVEDIVNYVGPKRIFLEAEPGGVVRCVREGVNQPGQRQSRKNTCGLSIQLGMKVYSDALENLGYRKIRSYLETQGDKAGFEYVVYEKEDVLVSTP